jgi:hypothetical protein
VSQTGQFTNTWKSFEQLENFTSNTQKFRANRGENFTILVLDLRKAYVMFSDLPAKTSDVQRAAYLLDMRDVCWPNETNHNALLRCGQ